MKSIYFDKNALVRAGLTMVGKKLWPGAVFAPFSPVRRTDITQPEQIPDQHVFLENRLCGICASDLHLVFVDVDPRVHPATIPGNPHLFLGHEVVSTVKATGAGTQYQTGDRVAMMSRFLGPTCDSQQIQPRCPQCEKKNYALCENMGAGKGIPGYGGGWGPGYLAHESEVWPVPDWMSDDDAALLEPLACGVRAVLRRIPAAGESSLVIGCGTIGLGTLEAVQAIAPQAHSHALARHPHQIARAEKAGATVHPGNALATAAKVFNKPVLEADFGNKSMLGGFDVVYDCVGSAASMQEALRATRAGGTVVIVGVNLHPVKLDLTPVWHQEVDLIGTLAHGGEDWNGSRVTTFDVTAELIQEGRISTEGFITHRFPLSAYRKAIDTATDKSSGSIKVVFDYTSGFEP